LLPRLHLKSPPFPYPPLFRSHGPRPPEARPQPGGRPRGDDRQDDRSEEQVAALRLEIDAPGVERDQRDAERRGDGEPERASDGEDRKSTRLNSSHGSISYAVF